MPSSTLPSWTVSLAGDGVSSSTGKNMVTALGGETSSKIAASSSSGHNSSSSLRRGQRPIFAHRNRPAKTNDSLTTTDDDVELEAVEGQEKENPLVVVAGENSSTAFSSPRTVLFSPKTTEAFPSTAAAAAAVADTELASTTIMIASLPAFAWKLHEKCRHEMFRRYLTWALVNLQMIVASAITITSAVLYGRYYTGYPFPLRLTDGQQEQSADPLAIALFGCTIVLPLYVTYLVKVRKTLADAPNPFPETMARVESEIYQFRTRVGPYKDSSSSTCREVFADRAKELWSKAASELTTTTTTSTSRRLELSHSFWEDDDERDADVGVKMYRQRRSSPDDDTRYSSHETTAFSQLPIPPTPTTSLQPTETTPMLLSLSPSENSNTSSKAAKQQQQQEFYSKDPRSLLPLDVYPSLRLCKMIKKKSDQIASWEFREQLITRIIQVVTLAATFTAILSLQWIVPILLAATAASASLLELGNYARAIQVETKTLEQLNDIYKRWKALEGEDLDDDDDAEKQQGSSNGDRQALVEEAEAQILSAVVQMHS